TPRASTTSALPARLETARLPCLATTTPSDDTTTAAAVDTLSVPSPSPPVPQVSSVAARPWSTAIIAPRMAAAASAMIAAVSPPHDFAFARPSADVEHIGKRVAFDQEGMVARRSERIGQAGEDRLAVVQDGGRLSVHEARGADDVPSERLADRLMPQANSQD